MKSAGRSFPVHYNGSTARLTFGLLAAARVRRWMADGNFDVVHLHEPGAPSLSVIAMWARLGPTVATFHTSNDDSRLMRLGKPWIKPGFEELDARIAVSPSAARTVKEHLRVDATHIIPNGVDTSDYVDATPRAEWMGTKDAPTIGILGRMDEPRKGLDDFLAAMPLVRRTHPRDAIPRRGALLGPRGGAHRSRRGRGGGRTRRGQKAEFMSSVDVYCAPNTGGESFGIVLVEAMAAGAAVVASDLVAFRDVATSDEGEECAAFFPVGDAKALAEQVRALLDDPERRTALALRGAARAGTFDWHQVAPRIEETYRDAIRLDASFFPQRAKETPA